jgi:hypothetical protein
MMKNLLCSKCRSKEIVRLPGDIQAPSIISGAKPPSTYRDIQITYYCCTKCGYIETWVNDPDDLKEILTKYGF